MKSWHSNLRFPIPVNRALYKLGQDMSDARKRRRIPVALMAERASISRTTLNKIEKGDVGVAIGHYASVLLVLGMIRSLGDLTDIRNDAVGIKLDEENLPKRIRRISKQKKN